jgi:hypothetical protein
MNSLLVYLTVFLFTSQAWTKVEIDSDHLKMKNAEQITAMVKAKIQKAQKIQAKQEDDDDAGLRAEPEAIEQLRSATLLIMSRPDQDGTRAVVFDDIRHELSDLGSVDSVLQDVASEAVSGMKSSSTPLAIQATYLTVLENLMAEVKPEVGSHPAFRKIIEQIRDADIEISDPLRAQIRLRSMGKVVSPSETAAAIAPKKK